MNDYLYETALALIAEHADRTGHKNPRRQPGCPVCKLLRPVKEGIEANDRLEAEDFPDEEEG